MALAQHSIEMFGRLRDRLVNVLASEAEIFELLGEHDRAGELTNKKAKLADECFRIIVMGEMKMGKSTLLNALIGDELLPMMPGVACTAIPISVRFGERKWAVCHRRSGEAPMECDPAKEMTRFVEAVTIAPKHRRIVPDDDASAIRMHPYERAELFAPVELLKHGAELQDSPGLNEDTRRSEITWKQVETSDAVILVLDCNAVDRQTDRDDLLRICSKGRDPRIVFVAWNYADDHRENATAYDRIQQDAKALIEPLGIPADHVCFISAREALRGRIRNEPALVQSSGVPTLEQMLSTFLVNERGAAKLLTPLNVAEHGVEEGLLDVLTRRTTEWAGPVQIAQDASVQTKHAAAHAKQARDRVAARLERAADHVRLEVSKATALFVVELVNGVSAAVEHVPVGNRDAVFQTRDSVSRIVEAADAWVRQRALKWEQSQLKPIVNKYGSEAAQHAEDAVEELTGDLTKVMELEQRVLNATMTEPGSSMANDVAAANGLHTDEIAEKIRGIAGEDFSDTSIALGAGIGALVGGAVWLWAATVMISLPVFLIIAAFAGLGALIGLWHAGDVLKGRTAAAIQKSLQDRAPELEKELLDRMTKACDEIECELNRKLDRFSQAIHRSCDAIERRLAVEQQLAAERRVLEKQLRSRLQKLKLELSELRREIDPLASPERMAAHIGRRIGQGGGPGGNSSSPQAVGRVADDLGLIELKAKLGLEGIGRIGLVRNYFVKAGSWRPEMEPKLMEMWVDSREAAGPTAVKEIWAYWTVSALAVSEDHDRPPLPGEVGKRFSDPAYQSGLAALYMLISGEEDDSCFRDSESGAGKVRFCKAYHRAYHKVFPPRASDGEIRLGTVIKDKEHREPYRPVP